MPSDINKHEKTYDLPDSSSELSKGVVVHHENETTSCQAIKTCDKYSLSEFWRYSPKKLRLNLYIKGFILHMKYIIIPRVKRQIFFRLNTRPKK